MLVLLYCYMIGHEVCPSQNLCTSATSTAAMLNCLRLGMGNGQPFHPWVPGVDSSILEFGLSTNVNRDFSLKSKTEWQTVQILMRCFPLDLLCLHRYWFWSAKLKGLKLLLLFSWHFNTITIIFIIKIALAWISQWFISFGTSLWKSNSHL